MENKYFFWTKFKSYAFLLPLLLLFFWAVLYPRTDIEGTTKLLNEQNYKTINVGGHAWFHTGKNWSTTKFKAISSRGDTVTGYSKMELFSRGSLFFN